MSAFTGQPAQGNPRTGTIRIGCSGWQYKSWRGRFYPDDLPTSHWLEAYAREFAIVEVNNTFYRLPERQVFVSWRCRSPPGFLIAVKASRYLTHLKRLGDPDAPLARLFQRALGLGPRLGPVLYQLPPQLLYDRARLQAFLKALPRRRSDVPDGDDGDRHVRPAQLRHVIEFRHPSWYRDDVFEQLREVGVQVCWHDMSGSAFDGMIDRFVYMRFHGSAGRYRGSYPAHALEAWARQFRAAASTGRDVYVLFNNDVDAAAIENARTLRALCSATVSGPATAWR